MWRLRALSKSKQKGTAFESLIVPSFNRVFPGTERRALAGGLDKGDLLLPGAPFVVEAKNTSRAALAQWAAEAEVEALNAQVPFWIVVHKRARKGRGDDQWVTTTVDQFLGIVESFRAGRG